MTDSRISLAALLLVLCGCTPVHVVLVANDAAIDVDTGAMPLPTSDGVSIGYQQMCLVSGGALRCTGSNRDGALGTGDGVDRTSPAPVGGAADVAAVSVGYDFACLLRTSGAVACFGTNSRGELATGDRLPRATPSAVTLPGAAVRVFAGFSHACALLRTGALWCWGSNAEGELGQGTNGTASDALAPVPFLADTAFATASMGAGHSCAVAVDGALYCTGRNARGELGLGVGAPPQLLTPMRVGPRRYGVVAVGDNFSCAISADTDRGALYCWGTDDDGDGHPGPLALPGAVDHFEPTQVGVENDWINLATDTLHTCGLRAGGALWCWGRNAEGQFGAGGRAIIVDPKQVEGTASFDLLDVGRFATCARRTDGVVLCTGVNTEGELGVGDRTLRDVLTPVLP